ncbi:transcriptional regulator, LysR family [Roseovarius pacificus]|uniref:Transcriptional regulator, LysR family n=1 Tax=Roseovarius pacificus TaxID=337701 RepID=A0A1M7A337_9RHOB|nr:LysR substrate-binding domain-containing protein [Roseovarius pacificus]GGO53949.1 transcriptional regulator [Roseovarius pacificus]SHL37070.1 transcriptional regulator, LysR family [Roseovarius pacificus]
MSRHMPSMRILRAFEATARHRSFTRAATELNLTQSAVSHQIRKLEELLGVQLLERGHNTITLTEAGGDYLSSARNALTEIQVATDRAIDRQRGDILTIACLGTFALKVLFPNLNSFIQQHPEIGLRVRTIVAHEQEAVSVQDYDVSIQYGVRTDWPELEALKIVDEQLFPVCSPLIGSELQTLSDLQRQTIIRTASPLILRDDWPLWLEKAGIPNNRFAAEINCDLLYPSYQAAIEGLGVAMGRSAVVKNDLQSGRLVEPFDIRLTSSLGYYLVMAPQYLELEKVKIFNKWALGNLSQMANI